MTIGSYSFGKIKINGEAYSSDVIIYQDRVDPSWWREEGHGLTIKDLDGPLKAKPEVLVIGTGYFGALKVPEETARSLRSRGIKVVIERTSKAVEIFNELQASDRNAVAALHLTC
jgi:hypothetical protein